MEHQSVGDFFITGNLIEVFLQISVETYPIVCMPRKKIRKVAIKRRLDFVNMYNPALNNIKTRNGDSKIQREPHGEF